LAAFVWLALLSQASAAEGATPALEFVDCAAISPSLTTELLAIELKTLGIAATPSMQWRVRCHGLKATVQFRSLAGQGDGMVSANVDLSSTDEAAWPRLIAISASELVEQRKRSVAMNTLAYALPPTQSLVRVQLLTFDAKNTKKDKNYLAALGLSLAREGAPGTNLIGASAGVDRRVGSFGLLGVDLRSQWGNSTLGTVSVKWQLINAALKVGATLDLRVVDVDATAGFRLGRLVLTGQTTAQDMAGRTLVGATFGPFVTVRLRRSLGNKLFFGIALEEGLCAMPVRGNNDGVSPLLSVSGLWSNATFSAGWRL
jgi:hypothetical protein